MNRRDALRTIASLAAIPALESLRGAELLGLGRRAHAVAKVQGYRTLDSGQGRLVAVIADLIIPATDTPGAAAAAVDRFTDVILTEWSSPDERDAFLRDLAGVDARARAAHGRGFVECSEGQQVAMLGALDAEAGRLAGEEAGRHIFTRLKWFTLWGYYTSRVGQELELDEHVIPPDGYQPCEPLPPGAGGLG